MLTSIGRLVVTMIASVCLILGCERQPVTPPPPGDATTNPAHSNASAPSTAPAASVPQSAEMFIDDRIVTFPPARLVLRPKGSHVYALLYSDDPPEAIHDSYTGNSFYFEMAIELSDAADNATAQWIYKAPSSERADTHSGIFLGGRYRHLQPFDVVVEFDGTSTPAKVWLSGSFLMFESDADPTVPGQLVAVRAELDASLHTKGFGR